MSSQLYYSSKRTIQRRLSVLAFGSDELTVSTLSTLWRDHKAGGVVSKLALVCPEDPASGPVLTKRWAENEGCPIHEVPSSAGFRLKTWDVPEPGSWDVGVVVSFGRFIPKRVRRAFPGGMINLHPSLLPQYRGASPIPYTILNGDTRSGVSVIEVADSMDHGAVYLQRECPIPHRPTRTQLFEVLGEFGADCILETLDNFDDLHAQRRSQDDLEKPPNIIHAPKIPKSLAHLDWSKDSETLDRIIRAVEGQFNCVSLFKINSDTRPERVVIQRAFPADVQISSTHQEPGSTWYDNSTLYIRCGSGVLGVEKLRFAVGKHHWPMTAEKFNEKILTSSSSFLTYDGS